MIYLSKGTDKQQQAYHKYFEDVLLSGKNGLRLRRPTEFYDTYGLRFPVNYLNALGQNIIFLPVEYMAEYVDMVCKEFTDGGSSILVSSILTTHHTDEELLTINATAIGNLAYIHLNHKNTACAKIAGDILQRLFVLRKGKLLNELNENLL